LRIAVVIALDDPFKTKVDQSGMVDDKLTWHDLVSIFHGGGAAARNG
jgi:hypothetical protein